MFNALVVAPVRVMRNVPASGPVSDAAASVAVIVTMGVALALIGVMLKSSTANPSSDPVASKLFQRIKNSAPLAMLKLLIVALTAVRLAAALPSNAPTVPTVKGPLKSSVSTSVHVPMVKLVAFRLY